MRFYVGALELLLSAALAIAAVTVLDLASPVGAALGVMLVPFLALATSHVVVEREEGEPAAADPAPGVCQCGHVMSMHCHADCSGPCAVPECLCEGKASSRAARN